MDQVWNQLIHHVEGVNKKNLKKLENIISDEQFETQLDELCSIEPTGTTKANDLDEEESDQDQQDEYGSDAA